MQAPTEFSPAKKFLAIGEATIAARANEGPAFRITGPFFAMEAWEGREPYPREWVVDGWLAAGSAALLAGEGGTGKSLLGQMLCTCAALGLPFLGLKVPTMRNAVYVTAEDDANELHHRQIAINKALGITMADLGEGLTLYSLKGDPACEIAALNERGQMEKTDLLDEIWRLDQSLTVLDNAAHMFPGDENNRRHVAAFLSLLDGMAMGTGGAVVLLAHTPKSGAEFSGSTGWDAHVRQRLYLKHDSEAGDPDLRVLSKSKSNYARRGETVQFRWHNGAFVLPSQLGELGVEIAAVAADNRDNGLFLACLAERNRQQRPVSERASKTYAPAVFATMPESKGIGKVRLEHAMDRLFRAGLIDRGFLFRDTAEGKDKHGLRQPANAPANRPLTPSANDRSPLPPTTVNTHPSPTERHGAALQGAAPAVNPDDDPAADAYLPS